MFHFFFLKINFHEISTNDLEYEKVRICTRIIESNETMKMIIGKILLYNEMQTTSSKLFI